MIKKILLALILISTTLQSQTSVTGTMDPVIEDYNYVILYQLKGAKQIYIANVTVLEGVFKMDFPENASKGMYRLTYDMKNGGFVDFLYNKESVELKFDPTFPSGTLEFIVSDENKTYTNYQAETNDIRRKLDSLQMNFFNLESENAIKSTQKIYKRTYEHYLISQELFTEKSEGQIANSFIKSSNKYYSPTLIKTPQEFLNSEKQHYFDFIDFNDSMLLNSIFYTERVTDYVFYLNTSDDVEVQNSLYLNSIKEVLEKIEENYFLKAELLTTLMYNFAQLESTVILDYVIDNFYKKLPEEFQNSADLKEIQSKVKLALGKTAPDFSWDVGDKTVNLSELNNASTYILVFWSTSCSHCLVEVPQLYEFIKDNEEVHVIAIALENDELGFNHHTQNFEKWTNVLGLEKWQNKIARKYEIVSTPTYFVLDSNKKIISKPEYVEDVKKFLDK
ncbi:TlpA family protein disulfide reductase [Lutibacter flavus]|uniref:Thioredoxin-like n=1 Tax=Lutibacter flavus TaxID=691689 RepID=A0A238WWT9_9FLAO|nr:TlpA disulfide reductase family protein [Lutibacter flavus]SNR50997.1 Thioredoxin-like [Lutibacter flavus]